MTENRILLTAEQLRMARAALRISVAQAAEMSGVSADTVRRLERYAAGPGTKTSSIEKLQTAYQNRGVIFLVETDSEPAGVRCRPQE